MLLLPLLPLLLLMQLLLLPLCSGGGDGNGTCRALSALPRSTLHWLTFSPVVRLLAVLPLGLLDSHALVGCCLLLPGYFFASCCSSDRAALRFLFVLPLITPRSPPLLLGARWQLTCSHEEAEAAIEKACARLVAARRKRPAPYLDDKVITAWNGLMVRT